VALNGTPHLGTALRAAAYAGLRTVYLVAEPATPCPTAGHRAALRAMRNVFVFRPADASETLECTELALRRVHGPSVLLLSEVPCAPLAERPTRTRCVHGGFLARAPSKRRDVTLIASGTELSLALQVHDCLARTGIVSAVVSLPCWELFANQEQEWRDEVLGRAPRVGIESGSGFGWERWLGAGGVFVGSGSGDESGLVTAERIMAAVHALLG
jgi:transketolase